MTDATSPVVTASTVKGDRGPALEMVDVSKSFGDVQVLRGASLVCYPGEVHALVGENGAGKSTLIKLASGMLRPDSGIIRIGGIELKKASAIAARKLGLLTAYQDTSLVPDLTAAENLVLSFHGHERTRRTLPFPGIAEIFKRYELPFAPGATVAELSPASRQLLEVVRTLIHRPKLLLLDEPTAALDVEGRRDFWSATRGFAARGRTVLFATHYLEEADAYADRIILMARGQVAADGPPTEMKAAVGGRVIRATLHEAAGPALAAIAGVTRAERHGESIALTCSDSDAALRQLLREFPECRDIEVRGLGLDDAFLQLTHDHDSALLTEATT